MTAIARVAVATRPRRSSKTAARRIWRPRPAGRSARSASPARSASTRRRISARSATAARSSPTTRALAATHQAPAQRRPDRSLPSSGAGRQLPARRDAGRDPARAAAAPAAAGPRDAARSPRSYRARLARPLGRRCCRSATPATSIICSSSRHARDARSDAAGASRRRAASRRWFTTRCRSRRSRRSRRCSRPTVRSRRGLRRGPVAAAPSRACTTTTSTRSPTPSNASRFLTKGLHRVRALITGGAGFIGSHLSEALLDARPRGPHPRQPVDRIDRQHRASQGPARVRVPHRLGRTTSRCSPS